MTLIELLVAVTIAALLLVTAAALLATIAQVRRDGERTLEVAGNANVAMALIQYDASRAGYRFASSAFTTYILNNVQGNEPELGSITDTANCGDSIWGVAKGTDVVEFREGNPNFEPGVLTNVNGAAPNHNVVFGLGAIPNPFDTTAGNGANEVVLFANSEMACAARVGVGGVTNAAAAVSLLKQDFTPASGSEYFNCPTLQMTVMRLSQRIRYLVCMPPSTQPEARPALYRQVSGPDGTFAPPGDMTLVQEGIEDLQVSPRIVNPQLLITGADCVASDYGAFCTCDQSAPCANYVPLPTVTGGTLDATPTATIDRRSAFLLRGLRIGVTAISTRSRVPRTSETGLETIVRPTLLDHLSPDAGDSTGGYCRGCQAQSGNYRASAVVDIVLNNLSMVVP